MLKLIAHNLIYLGLVLVIESDTKHRHWAGTAIFASRQVLYASGSTPKEALEALIVKSLGLERQPATENFVYLDPIAQDLLQLILQRADSSPEISASWIATARLRRRWLLGSPSTIEVTSPQPDEALEKLVIRVKEKIR